ncbi:hypothetical protein ABVF11_07365 [Pediococcus argentinicus]|uniref:hypothetical protein n=1 Tax=Pediococcus argentinicus TaxID=480391 RepID=UPI00338E5DA4
MKTTLHFSKTINAPIDELFNRVADMKNYHEWLPNSNAFGGTKDIEPYPVQLGTKYLDYGPSGQRPGEVNFFVPNKKIGFHHSMDISQMGLNIKTDIQIDYTFEETNKDVKVSRTLIMTINSPISSYWGLPFVMGAFVKENFRLMGALKKFSEQ